MNIIFSNASKYSKHCCTFLLQTVIKLIQNAMLNARQRKIYQSLIKMAYF